MKLPIALPRRFGGSTGVMNRVLPVACLCVATLSASHSRGDTIVHATYDVDSYMFLGYNTVAERGLSLTEDFSGGVIANNNSHFIFSLIKFDDLTGLKTKAAGGGDKFLRLATDTFPGPATVGVSIALADIEADDQTGYPSPMFENSQIFLGKTGSDRLRWYKSNIKGDDPAYGGYAGGAPHLGVINFSAAGTYQIDVTEAVDSWVSGARPNFGFGLWGVSVVVEDRDAFDLVSLENPNASTLGPALIVSGESSTPAPGDANGDGVVDRRDVVRLMANYGRAGAGLTVADGDFDASGSVTLADLMIVQAHLSPAGSPLAASAVPEPSGIAMCGLGAIGLAVLVRRRR
jgi:hypothetical protein